MSKFLRWLKIITLAYLAIGVIVGFVFFALADFEMDWTFDNLKLFLYIILAWPLWVWFMVVMWMSSRYR